MAVKKIIEIGAVLGMVMMTLACPAGATFLLAGDSTLDDYGRKPRGPYASWGTVLEKSMKPGCKVDNYARSGASTKSFIASGQWEKLVAAIKPGDFVGIQFGHNDQKWSTPFYVEQRFADPNGLFRENVRKFVAEIRAKGGKPVLMSPIVRGTFGKDGKLYDSVDKKGISLGSYAKAMQELSVELKTEFVDMNRLTHDLLEKVGKDASMKFFVIFTLLAFLCVMGYIDIFKYLVGDKFREGLGIVPIVMMAEIFMGVYFNLSFWYNLIDKTIYGAWFSLAGCAVLFGVNVIFIPQIGYWACAWGGLAGYGTAMVLSYLVGQKQNPIPYPMKDIAIYFISACAFFTLMKWGERNLPAWASIIWNTLMILGFIYRIIKTDMPLSSLPVIGKKFKK